MSREAEKKRLVKLWKEARKMAKEANSDIEREMIFADYLLDNGVIVPPCKAGQTVWVLGCEYFWEAKIARVDIHVWENRKEAEIYFVYNGESELNMIDSSLIGKEMFFSKAEAAYALKNRRSVSLVNGHIEE